LPVKPGDPVILHAEGKVYLRKYRGIDEESGGAWLDLDQLNRQTSELGWSRGPFPIRMLRHPDLLKGIIQEIDRD